MAPLSSEVFFYGLFMDPAVLETKGISGPRSRPGILRDWAAVGEYLQRWGIDRHASTRFWQLSASRGALRPRADAFLA
jgi:hypothetical protein